MSSLSTQYPFIQEIRIITSKDPNDVNFPTDDPDLWVKVNVNLNAGTIVTGDYIYLFYKKTSTPDNAITGLEILCGCNPGTPSSFKRLTNDVDLNLGALGYYSYLVYTTVTREDLAIGDLTVVKGSNRYVYPPSTDPSGATINWIRLNQECNHGTGGDYIYIFYTLVSKKFVPADV